MDPAPAPPPQGAPRLAYYLALGAALIFLGALGFFLVTHVIYAELMFAVLTDGVPQ